MVPASSPAYVLRRPVDTFVAQCLAQGTGAYALEGPAGAGKSTALLHGLSSELSRRGKAARGFVRIVQLWGDEPPSSFAKRLVREVGYLNLVPYPQPDKLAHLIADMAQLLPGLAQAGKLLASLVPDDMRPLPTIAAQALAESGQRALASQGPLVIGIDLLGGEVTSPVREFFARLTDLLPPTVVLLFAQPGGQQSLVQLPPDRRITLGALSPEQALHFLEDRIGALDEAALTLLHGGQLSLLPGDLSYVVNLAPLLGHAPDRGLAALLDPLTQDVSTRYQRLIESALSHPQSDPRVLELVALCALTTRPQHPLTLERALSRMHGHPPPAPMELSQIRHHPLVAALCATSSRTSHAPSPSSGPQTSAAPAWPLLPSSLPAGLGVRTALSRQGLVDLYERRWLAELVSTLRNPHSPDALGAGAQALILLCERSAQDAGALAQALSLLTEMEGLLWQAGAHRGFAELYDTLLPHLRQAGLDPRLVAPKLWFRRARARIQLVDWSLYTQSQGAVLLATPEDLPLLLAELSTAQEELSQLFSLSEPAIVHAQEALGLHTKGEDLTELCHHLPWKARQARGYARVLQVLLAPPDATTPAHADDALHRARTDILGALSHVVAAGQHENIAQTLTILADADSVGNAPESDTWALHHYQHAVEIAAQLVPVPAFCLGLIHRARAHHHRRVGRPQAAQADYARARHYLLSSPDARMGSLLANLIPQEESLVGSSTEGKPPLPRAQFLLP